MEESEKRVSDQDVKKNTATVTVLDTSSEDIDYIGSFSEEFIDRFLHKIGQSYTIDKTLPKQAEFMLAKVNELTFEDSIVILTAAYDYHTDDPNFPEEDYEFMKKVINQEMEVTPEVDFDARVLAALNEYYSPYPEVRAVTDPYDDQNVPIETIRSYTLAIFWTILGTGFNEFFGHRMPKITISSAVVQVLLYPCGKLWALVIPDWSVGYGKYKLKLNPGPWTNKEQLFATILYNVTSSGVHITQNIVTMYTFYEIRWMDFGFMVLITLLTQFMGFSLAGIMRKFVVYPVRALWPTVMPTLALNRALLKPEKGEIIHGWKISKYNFFWVFFLGSFLYFWLPNYLFQALSTFNWINWIAPDNFNLAVVSGETLGLGLNPIPTLDWNVMNNLILGMTIPFYSTLNQVIGAFGCFFVILAVFYSNYKWTGFLPINSLTLFTNTGEEFDANRVLDDRGFLDEEKYHNYSPPFYGSANLVCNAAYLAAYPFSFVHATFAERKGLLQSAKQVWATIKNFRRSNFENLKDPHSRMMSKYKEVPDWYFLVILCISLALAIICVKTYPVNTPVWGIFLTLVIVVGIFIPFTLLYAVTGYQIGVNVLIEFTFGFLLPGNSLALMTLKTLGNTLNGQADSFISDQKIAHYAKIPPMAIFRGQMITTFISCFVFLGVVNWSLSNIVDFCKPGQPQRFTCPTEQSFYNTSIFWGVVGPDRLFRLYPILKWCFLIGFLMAVLFIGLKLAFPKHYPKNFHPDLIIAGFILFFAPYTLAYLIPPLYLGFAFMYVIRRRYLAWFEKYNYVLSAALDGGLALSAIIIFFAVQYNPKPIDWWGNRVSTEGIDGMTGRLGLLEVSSDPRGYFGPNRGEYP